MHRTIITSQTGDNILQRAKEFVTIKFESEENTISYKSGSILVPKDWLLNNDHYCLYALLLQLDLN